MYIHMYPQHASGLASAELPCLSVRASPCVRLLRACVCSVRASAQVFWGNLVDRLGFFRGYAATSITTILLMLALPWTVGSKLAFGSAICGTLFCLGGSIAMFVTVNAQVFGTRNAGEIYSLLFSAFAFASVFGAKITIGLVGKLGWLGVFRILAGLGCTAVTLLALLRKEKQNPAAWD